VNLAFVFPGQGAQAVGMGVDLYENNPAARAVLDAFPATLRTLCFEGPEDQLKDTRNTQPALFAVSVAALEAVKAAGFTPAVCAGHSIGEYAALVAAGALTVEEGARLVQIRGRAMAEAAVQSPGTMAAVLGLDADVIREVCASLEGIVVPANDNAPGQVVLSGEVAAVEAASVVLKERGAKRVLPLAVAGGFHSPLMQPAATTLRDALATAEILAPTHPILANVTADYESTPDEIRKNLAEQVAGPVRWTETIQRLTADGYTTFIECGSGTVLAGLIRRIAPEATTHSVGDTVGLAKLVEALS
jgi:[acyl-carrier-protein] S-malonyltransferase